MLSVMIAISAATLPTGIEVVALSPCAPARHAACVQPAQRDADASIRIGKRCHPDSTKAPGCREILAHEVARRSTTLAQAK